MSGSPSISLLSALAKVAREAGVPPGKRLTQLAGAVSKTSPEMTAWLEGNGYVGWRGTAHVLLAKGEETLRAAGVEFSAAPEAPMDAPVAPLVTRPVGAEPEQATLTTRGERRARKRGQ